MIGKEIEKILLEHKKDYFTFAQLANYLSIKKSTLKVILSRLVKQGRVLRLIKGYYCHPQKMPDLERLACELCYPSYISLESALSLHGVLSQIPSAITMVTSGRSVNYNIRETLIECSHIKKPLFFGYEINGQAQIARPEKALLDELYLIGLGKRTLNIKELDCGKLNKKLFREWIGLYPTATKELAASIKIF
ncbi:MAG: type IV toxin-antitoxin system AbiEi family antitoxin domain-containing protein [Candidatus Omnitrophota bacterium]